MANFRRKISSCIQRGMEVTSIVRYIVRYLIFGDISASHDISRYVDFLHMHAEMEDGLSELASIVEEAVKCGHEKVVEVLFSCVSSTFPAFFLTGRRQEPDLEWYIPKLKFTPEGDTILHILCASKKWEEPDKEEQLKKLLLFLIDKKYANLKAKNVHMQMPFHLACSLRTPVAAEVLLQTQKVTDVILCSFSPLKRWKSMQRTSLGVFHYIMPSRSSMIRSQKCFWTGKKLPIKKQFTFHQRS